ncbi:MAG: glycoside hydrolase family 3 C-terminal domain-containing protein [Cytophagaceae bacterium]|nr:glycoside hydrolase family 3 C-terminal domain-containing protein [Cytophagaceae bacterium]
MKRIVLLSGLIASVLLICSITLRKSDKTLPYKNPKLSVNERVKDLLGRMTLEEKVAQTQCIWQQKSMIMDDKGNFSPEKAQKVLQYGIGQIARPSEKRGPKEMAELTNTIQKFIMENTRLGIPVIFHEECLHGHAAPQGTSFPQPIALASTWNTELISEIFTAVAEETRVRGGHQALTPVLDVARDPRWGRVEETYGEDPYLCSEMGLACVKAFQGTGPFIDKKHVASTLKHFAVHSQPESGINCAPANYSERTIRDIFLPPFKKAIQEGKALSVMASYNEIDGIPSHANKWLLQKILREEWGFNGVVVSDYYGVKELNTLHNVAKSKEEAAKIAFETGVEIETPDIECYNNLLNLVKEGKISVGTLDTAVSRILRVKFLLGLFDDPYVDPNNAEKIVGSQKNRDLALKAARQSIILLKNQNNLLPLSKSAYKKIAVIGPNADKCILGGYSDEPKVKVTPLQGIKAKLGTSVEVLYSEGCQITKPGGSWYTDKVELSDPKEDEIKIKEAVEVAKKSEIVVLFVGGNEETSREAWAKNHLGDRSSLGLVGAQNDLVRAILATGKPTIVFLFNGSPLTFNYINENVPAIFECWYLGQETGHAVADVLFGDYNPAGKLPITIPRSEGQLPVFYNYKPSAKRGYIFDTPDPLYSFGYGLSYTTFKYDNLKISAPQMKSGESVTVSIDVTNTGKIKGDEIVQLYINDKVSSVTRPVKELKGFKRITLEAGETKTVDFMIDASKLSFYDINMNYTVEPGYFEIMVGASSVDNKKIKLEVL